MNDSAKPAGDELAREAHRLHRAVFGKDAPPDLVAQYVEAHRYFLSERPTSPSLRRAFESEIDLEALELATRGRTVLTSKFHILLYLVEARAGYQNSFVNGRTRRMRTFLSLSMVAVRTSWKFAKGVFLRLRYGNL